MKFTKDFSSTKSIETRKFSEKKLAGESRPDMYIYIYIYHACFLQQAFFGEFPGLDIVCAADLLGEFHGECSGEFLGELYFVGGEFPGECPGEFPGEFPGGFPGGFLGEFSGGFSMVGLIGPCRRFKPAATAVDLMTPRLTNHKTG